jgi:hypothetical protein
MVVGIGEGFLHQNRPTRVALHRLAHLVGPGAHIFHEGLTLSRMSHFFEQRKGVPLVSSQPGKVHVTIAAADGRLLEPVGHALGQLDAGGDDVKHGRFDTFRHDKVAIDNVAGPQHHYGDKAHVATPPQLGKADVGRGTSWPGG